MRVSTGMIYSQLTERMSDNSAEMAKMQARLSLGTKYVRPSEAPDEVARVQSHESRLKRLDTDVESISRTKIGVDAQVGAMRAAGELMDRLKEVAFQAANTMIGEGRRQALAEEVDAIQRSLIDLANTRDADDRYVFAGINSSEPPYALNADGSVVYSGASAPLRVRVTDVGFEDVTVPGPTIFKPITNGTISKGFFQVIGDLGDALRDNNESARAQALAEVDQLVSNSSASLARLGGTQQRLQLIEDQARETSVRARDTLSSIKDLDYAAALTDLQKQEVLLQASQSMMARMAQLSLLDVIR
jgi:flagellar hook-associated protein 3 FlgL